MSNIMSKFIPKLWQIITKEQILPKTQMETKSIKKNRTVLYL